MNYSVYIRPLQLEDALISCQWRNNPRIWEHTGSKPSQYISPEMETEWLAGVFNRKNEKRFAICLKKNDQYVGNIYLTDITAEEAQIHIFIGELDFWGKHKAFEAISLIIKYSFEVLYLDRIYAVILDTNRAPNALANIFGGSQTEEYYDENRGATIRKWILTRQVYETNPKKESDTPKEEVIE
jgi:RimJ/RimL family protein N-acetyltransferase